MTTVSAASASRMRTSRSSRSGPSASSASDSPVTTRGRSPPVLSGPGPPVAGVAATDGLVSPSPATDDTVGAPRRPGKRASGAAAGNASPGLRAPADDGRPDARAHVDGDAPARAGEHRV